MPLATLKSSPLPHFPTSPLPHFPTPYTPHPAPGKNFLPQTLIILDRATKVKIWETPEYTGSQRGKNTLF
ncbi:MAG: hypothetical protein RPG89_16410 [Microcystis panniformis WG22]|nr:hypothetical protein [Microcystis panniformis WG22]